MTRTKWWKQNKACKHDKNSILCKKAGNLQRKERTQITRPTETMCGQRIARVHQRDSFTGVKQRSVFGGRTRRHSRVTLQRISMSIIMNYELKSPPVWNTRNFCACQQLWIMNWKAHRSETHETYVHVNNYELWIMNYELYNRFDILRTADMLWYM